MKDIKEISLRDLIELNCIKRYYPSFPTPKIYSDIVAKYIVWKSVKQYNAIQYNKNIIERLIK